MNKIELLNETLKKKFEGNKSYTTFEPYAMSELLAPICDYYNFMDLVESNYDLLKGYELLYVAADTNILWPRWQQQKEDGIFLKILLTQFDKMNDYNKAIVCYLNAQELRRGNIKERIENKHYREMLEKSITYSKDIKFVNNYLDLAQISEGGDAKKLYKQAFDNIIQKPIPHHNVESDLIADYDLTAKKYINSFILGTYPLQNSYQTILNKLN